MDRSRRYPSDLTDTQWELYLDRTGCQWDALPADFPHHKFVYHYFKTWTRDGTLNRMHNSLREQVRAQVEGRNRQPTAALVDSQSVRGAETVGRATRGYDAGKKINGRKRHTRSTPAACSSRSWSPARTSRTAMTRRLARHQHT
jgi:transposase